MITGMIIMMLNADDVPLRFNYPLDTYFYSDDDDDNDDEDEDDDDDVPLR